MKFYNKIIISFILILIFYGGNVHSQTIAPYLLKLDYNADIDYSYNPPPVVKNSNLGEGKTIPSILGGPSLISVLHNNVIIDNIGTPPNTTESPAFIINLRGAVVDGFHKDSNGIKYFSFDADTLLLGLEVLKSDIIKCTDIDCNGYVFFFDSNANNLKDVNINAFTLDPNNGELIFSIESDGKIGATSFLAADLIRFDGTNFSLVYDSLDAFTRYKNIDALTFLPNNRYLVSFANESVFHEIFEYNLTTGVWSTAYTPFYFGFDGYQMNMSSLMGYIKPLAEVIFSDGFE